MHKEYVMGNEAIALGALAAGVNVVAGYPGTPSTEVLETVAKIVGVGIEISVDPARIRPADNHVIIGSNEKMNRLGWTLRHTLESSIRDMVACVESDAASLKKGESR